MTAVESITSLLSEKLEFPLAIYKKVCVCWEMHNGSLIVDLWRPNSENWVPCQFPISITLRK